MTINEMFAKECEKIDIPFEKFPFDFAMTNPVNYSAIIEAMMWLLKKRQDKMLGERK